MGRLGEMKAMKGLVAKYPEAEFIWLNEERESGAHCDIQMRLKGRSWCPIEVKTTSGGGQMMIAFTGRELACAEASRDYVLVRVFCLDPASGAGFAVEVALGSRARLIRTTALWNRQRYWVRLGDLHPFSCADAIARASLPGAPTNIEVGDLYRRFLSDY